MSTTERKNPATYVPPQRFVDWLEEGDGRAAYFGKVDPTLFPAQISKMKHGVLPISFEYAIRLERAQKPSVNPLKALELMTFQEHRDLYLYVTGQRPAPEPLKLVRKARSNHSKNLTTAKA